MKDKSQNLLPVWVSIFTLICVVAIGTTYLALERSQKSSIANTMSSLNRKKESLNREHLDLSSRIANLESPEQLRMRLGNLVPMYDNMVVMQSYDEEENKKLQLDHNLALGYNTANIVGTINSTRR